MRSPTLGGASAAAALIVAAPLVSASPYADRVVSYDAGSNPAGAFLDPTTALGMPERFTGEGIFPAAVTPFSSAFGADEIVSIGFGGALVLAFDVPVTNDPANPFGIDLLVFGNAFFLDGSYPAGIVDGLFGAPGGMIDVSADGVTWCTVPGAEPDGLFPTCGYADVGPYDTRPGDVPTDFTTPVDPSFVMSDLLGMDMDDLLVVYDGSGGGLGIDLASVGLEAVSFVRIRNENPNDHLEIDAVADVAPAAGIGDLDGDGAVGAPDLAILLARWGGPGSGDLDGSGTVDAADLAILLGHWTAG